MPQGFDLHLLSQPVVAYLVLEVGAIAADKIFALVEHHPFPRHSIPSPPPTTHSRLPLKSHLHNIILKAVLHLSAHVPIRLLPASPVIPVTTVKKAIGKRRFEKDTFIDIMDNRGQACTMTINNTAEGTANFGAAHCVVRCIKNVSGTEKCDMGGHSDAQSTVLLFRSSTPLKDPCVTGFCPSKGGKVLRGRAWWKALLAPEGDSGAPTPFLLLPGHNLFAI